MIIIIITTVINCLGPISDSAHDFLLNLDHNISLQLSGFLLYCAVIQFYYRASHTGEHVQ